jgi:hypothetical protein
MIFPISSPIDVVELAHIQTTLDSIVSKIFPNIVTNEQELEIRANYKNPKLVQSWAIL